MELKILLKSALVDQGGFFLFAKTCPYDEGVFVFQEVCFALFPRLGCLGVFDFAYIPFLQPLGDAVGPRLVELMPVVLFALLYVTFCKIEIKEMKPKAWHFVLQLIRTSLALLMVIAICLFGKNYEAKVILEGAFICFICPTAAAWR